MPLELQSGKKLGTTLSANGASDQRRYAGLCGESTSMRALDSVISVLKVKPLLA